MTPPWSSYHIISVRNADLLSSTKATLQVGYYSNMGGTRENWNPMIQNIQQLTRRDNLLTNSLFFIKHWSEHSYLLKRFSHSFESFNLNLANLTQHLKKCTENAIWELKIIYNQK